MQVVLHHMSSYTLKYMLQVNLSLTINCAICSVSSILQYAFVVLAVPHGTDPVGVLLKAVGFFLGAVGVAARGPSYLFIRTMRVAMIHNAKHSACNKQLTRS